MTAMYDRISCPTVDGDGDRAVYAAARDPTGGNPELSDELWLVDWTAPARIQVGEAAPTLVSWDPDPRAVRYDVIRGDVANLRHGSGGTVDLGAVAWLENDSPDAHTTGFEDTGQPAPGQAPTVPAPSARLRTAWSASPARETARSRPNRRSGSRSKPTPLPWPFKSTNPV